jgi:tripartite ATP-independent transporter DctP family solute receptor
LNILKSARGVTALLAMSTFTVCSPVVAQVVELNLGHVVSTASTYHIAAVKMAEVAAQKSNGQIKINVFPSAQLGNEPKQIQAIRTGTQDISIVSEAPLEATAKEYTVFSMPYVFADEAEARKILTGPVGREMLDMLDKYNMVGLEFICAMERDLMTTGKVVAKADDLKGMKVRVIPGPGYVATYKALGAQPTPTAYTELYMALQNGTVDAAENTPDTIINDRFIEVIKTASLAKIQYMPALIIMSKSKMASLSPEHQKIIREAAAEASKAGFNSYVDAYNKALGIMKSRINVVEPDLASFRAAAPEVHKAVLKDFPMAQEWYDKIKASLKK